MITPTLPLHPTSHVAYRPPSGRNQLVRKCSPRPRFPIYRSLYEVLETAPTIPFDNSARLVFFGDCHRGAGDWSDQFLCNKSIYCQALTYYLDHQFTYIELGDGDELWKSGSGAAIRQAHREVFALLRYFHRDGRLYKVWGNHDVISGEANPARQSNNGNHDRPASALQESSPDIQAHEGLLLKYLPSGTQLLAVHGHQVDLLSSRLSTLSRLIVGSFWKQMQRCGFRDPTSPAQNHAVRNRLERRIARWVKDTRRMVLCGHTHRPVFPQAGQVPYFNVGSCIYPGSITCIEICNGDIALVKWHMSPGLRDNSQSRLARTLLAAPRHLPDCANWAD